MRWADLTGCLVLALIFGLGLYKFTLMLMRGMKSAETPQPTPTNKDKTPNE